MHDWMEAVSRDNEINSADIAFADLTQTLNSSASEALWCASVLASAAVQNGDVCVTLAAIAETTSSSDSESIRDELVASSVVQHAEKPVSLPLVLDDSGRLYLARYWQAELELAEMLLALLQGNPGQQSEPPVDLLDQLFPPKNQQTEPDWQRVAAVVAARQRLCVITGGPGTGKTRTVARLLAVLQHQTQETMKIALLAPTGKAAARLLES